MLRKREVGWKGLQSSQEGTRAKSQNFRWKECRGKGGIGRARARTKASVLQRRAQLKQGGLQKGAERETPVPGAKQRWGVCAGCEEIGCPPFLKRSSAAYPTGLSPGSTDPPLRQRGHGRRRAPRFFLQATGRSRRREGCSACACPAAFRQAPPGRGEGRRRRLALCAASPAQAPPVPCLVRKERRGRTLCGDMNVKSPRIRSSLGKRCVVFNWPTRRRAVGLDGPELVTSMRSHRIESEGARKAIKSILLLDEGKQVKAYPTAVHMPLNRQSF
ncbi:uncharacterized protein LOC133371687 [Rhineura floridana]|uniref:uncharacterized protein LOC133371687 n=1 Tax=Rhineura floridana TaxID=261503 RepID=UPI002AC88357|nr:uncharacterized protein LOC133371687 [Rhineura floridana]